MVRMVFSDFTAKEDLLKILSMKGWATGEDVYKIFITNARSTDMPLQKLSEITTVRAPAMVGNVTGFTAFYIKDELLSNFFSYHCIVYQEALCGRILLFRQVMKTITKVVDSRSSFATPPFQGLIRKSWRSSSHSAYWSMLVQ